jgi:hypothetical protein
MGNDIISTYSKPKKLLIMEAQQTITAPPAETTVFIKMVISNWELQNARLNKLLNNLSDEQLLAPTAPGRNRGIYLLGHLIAVNDGMRPLMGLGERLYPELEAPFVTNPDNPAGSMPSLPDLRQYWQELNAKLSASFAAMPATEWFTRHSSVSPEDFAKEPHRNKLNILINRTNHQSYHLGQLVYLSNKQ